MIVIEAAIAALVSCLIGCGFAMVGIRKPIGAPEAKRFLVVVGVFIIGQGVAAAFILFLAEPR